MTAPQCEPRSSDRDAQAQLTLGLALSRDSCQLVLDAVSAPLARLDRAGTPTPGDESDTDVKRETVHKTDSTHPSNC